MLSADSANPAWLTVPPADGLPGQVAAEIGPVADKIGFVPNVARLMAISPDQFTGRWRYLDELMRGPLGLGTTQREMIALVVSAEARCPYCQAVHAAAPRLRTKDPVLAGRLAVNYRHVEFARLLQRGRAGQRGRSSAAHVTARRTRGPGCKHRANCHPLQGQHVAGALQQGLTASQVRSAIKMAQIIQRHAAESPRVKLPPPLTQPGSIQRLPPERRLQRATRREGSR